MTHSFDVEIAKSYGLLEAIMLNNIAFWVQKNEANGVNRHEGRHWTFNSAKAFERIFPYASAKQIRGALEHLKNAGLIDTGTFNEEPRDRTLWYTLTEKGKCICPTGQMEVPHRANASAPQGTPLPDNKHSVINADIKESVRASFKAPTLDEIRVYCQERKNAVDPERFLNYYTANGWRVGRNPMKDWRAAVRNWERTEKKPRPSGERAYTDDFFKELEERDK